MKFIIVTGGIISGLGKGITSSSIGLLLKTAGYNVTMIKIDPYLNCTSGLLNPMQHGECFVTEDGVECDLDIGNYERFLNVNLTGHHSITTGKVYQSVINKEKMGVYLGDTVQVVPHVTNEIIDQIREACEIKINGSAPEICIIEVGGTIGDIEGLPFIEAIQQMRNNIDDMFCFIHVVMVIYNPEIKTKPIQHSISSLRSRGIFPDLLIVRANNKLPLEIKEKLNKFCQIQIDDIISNPNVSTIYNVPTIFNEQNVCSRIGKRLQLSINSLPDPCIKISNYFNSLESLPIVNIAIVGKYISNTSDTYLSLVRSIEYSSMYLNVKSNIHWIESESLTNIDLIGHDAFIIPGGFGSRGIAGKLKAAKFTRENNIPVLGICLGMQIMVIEYYNSFCGGYGCSKEWPNVISDDNTMIKHIVDILPDQTGIMNGTMRLGNYNTVLYPSKVRDMYGVDNIVERHRHRYEVNNKYVPELESAGLKFVGKSKINEQTELMEVIELPEHTFYVGCQYHPEYQSRYETPHPLFTNLIIASLNKK